MSSASGVSLLNYVYYFWDVCSLVSSAVASLIHVLLQSDVHQYTKENQVRLHYCRWSWHDSFQVDTR